VTVRVTVDEQDVYPPRVLVTVTGLTIGDFVTVYRVVAGERTAVRQGAAEAVDVAFLVLDAELPFGTPVRYVAVVSSDTDVLGEPGNANPYFETDASDWTATGGAAVRSTAQAHEGVASLQLTPDGVTGTARVECGSVGGAAAGDPVGGQAWVRCASARNIVASLKHYTAAAVLDSTTSAAPVAVAANTWTLIEVDGTAPVAGRTALSIEMTGTPPAGHVLHVDEAYVASIGVEHEHWSTAATYTLPDGQVVVSDAIAGTAASCVITAWPRKRYDRLSSTFRTASGRTVVVAGPTPSWTGLIEFYVETDAARAALATVLSTATAGIVQIRQPGGYDGVDCYVAVTAFEEVRFSQNGSDPRRTYAVDAVQVERWAEDLEALGYTYADLVDVYDTLTYADLTGDYATYLDLAQAELIP
jgi:hypothetical protein